MPLANGNAPPNQKHSTSQEPIRVFREFRVFRDSDVRREFRDSDGCRDSKRISFSKGKQHARHNNTHQHREHNTR